MAFSFPRGGATAATAAATSTLQNLSATPQALFNTLLTGLALTTTIFKVAQRISRKSSTSDTEKDSTLEKSAEVKSLQARFLAVFWLLRCSDWLQGPYFYEVYASKVINGIPASMALVSRLFLTGFASTALFGPLVGRAADQYGRKKATLAFSLIYSLGALSTKSPLLIFLFLGRVMSGIGTSLLFSAPESWLVGAAQSSGNQAALGETFGLAYAGDSLVAIAAGQLAGLAASQRGPTGPFELSTVFLTMGGLLAAWLWKENKAQSTSNSTNGDKNENPDPSIGEAIRVVRRDPKIMLVGAVQSLFESAMYIFVLQWPPAVAKAIAQHFGANAVTPYGTVFSCFMASCLLGSTLFGQLSKQSVPTEASTTFMLSAATLAMSAATWTVRSVDSGGAALTLPCLITALFCFEACVGMYFPSIGTLRSRYVPDSHRSVIMNLFGIPLNVLVVAVFLSIQTLGVTGALTVSSVALGVATAAMGRLWQKSRQHGEVAT
jgi:MFS family permease